MANPLISVIVPVYNVAPYLEKCLDSILAQTYPHLEIIVVNDGSTDGGGAICDAYAGRDGRIRVLHQTNGGISAARNSGLALAGGDYIGFVDSDDWILPEMYAELLHLAHEYGADMVQCGVLLDGKSDSLVREKETPRITQIAGENLLDAAVRNKLSWVAWCNLYSAALWGDLRFDEGYYYEDALIFPAIAGRCKKFVKTSRKLYNYNRFNTGIMRSKKNMLHLVSKENVIEKFVAIAKKKAIAKETVALYLCKFIPSYRLAVFANEHISRSETQVHNRKMHGIFCQYYQSFRTTGEYCASSLLKRIYWRIYFYSPKLSTLFLQIYKRICN